MASHFTVGSSKALEVFASIEDPATIHNSSGGTLYYKSAPDVDSADSSLANGSSVEVTVPNWVISSASTHVFVERNKDRGDKAYPEAREEIRTVDGPVVSGTQAIGGTLAGVAETDTVIFDKTTKTHFVNENTAASPYWTPVSFDSPGILGGSLKTGKPIADTATAAISDGVRIFGQGIADTDSGVIPAAAGVEGSQLYTATTTNEAAHLVALGGEAGIFQPDTHGTTVIDIEYTHVSAITLRTMFVGFVGAAVDAMDPVVDGATTTATFAIDDLVGVFFDVGNTDGDRWFSISEKGNAAGTQDLSATGDTSTDTPAAGTYQRIRIEVHADGKAYVFFDKALLSTTAIAGASGAGAHASAISYDVDEEFTPVAYLESTSAATKSINIKSFRFWGTAS